MLEEIDKAALVASLCEQLAEKRRTIEVAADAAREAATHEESKPENDKDTRALEASYLAGAQAARARELQAVQNALSFLPLRSFRSGDPIDLSALVEVHAGARITIYFVAPHGGGMKARVAGVEVTVVAPDAPIGQALIGRVAGDDVTVNGRELGIVSVR
jgi:transcription elongation GreA/GreB family factor